MTQFTIGCQKYGLIFVSRIILYTKVDDWLIQWLQSV